MNLFFKICGLIIPLTFSVYAQTPIQSIKFTNINAIQGLSHNTVNCVIQDDHGFLWFGTANGLSRYDGYQFKVYHNEPDNANSLSNNYVLSLYQDRRGYIWIGTFGGGVNRFNPDTGEFVRYKYNKNDLHSISGNDVRAFYEDEESKLWVSFYKGSFGYFDVTQKFHRVNKSDTKFRLLNAIYSFVNDEDKGFWLGSQDGLIYFDKEQERIVENIKLKIDQKVHNYYGNAIYKIYKDQKSPYILWLCTFRHGLIKFDTRTKKIVQKWHKGNSILQTSSVWSFYQDQEGVCWVGTSDGFYRFMSDTGAFTLFLPNATNDFSISGKNIQYIFEDKAGKIWLCTYDKGLSLFDPYAKNFTYYAPLEKSIEQISSFCEDKQGNIWFGTLGGSVGLARLNRKTGEIKTFPPEINNPHSIEVKDVNVLLNDVDGSVWVGTFGGGLKRYDLEKGVFEHYFSKDNKQEGFPRTSDIGALYQDPNKPNDLWVGTRGDALYRFDKKEKKFQERYSLSHVSVIAITKDYKGNLWIATRRGLNKLDLSTKKIVSYLQIPENPNSISDNYIVSLHIDKDKNLWVGTRNGLNKCSLPELYKGNTKFQHFTTKQGLPDNIIHKIVEDSEGLLWLSTSKGLSCFDKNRVVKNYAQPDGLQSDQFATNSGLLTNDQAILMGGVNGFNLFYPQKLQKSTYTAPVLFTDFQIFNKSVPITKAGILHQAIWATDTIELSHKDQVISFEFASLNYGRANKSSYAIFMENFDEDWRYIGHKRFETYTNIPAGTYTFRVKAANGDKVWGKKEARLVIIIHSTWWRTRWFKVSIILWILCILLGRYYVIKKAPKSRKGLPEPSLNKLDSALEHIEKAVDKTTPNPVLVSIFKDQEEIDQLKQKLREVVVIQELYKEEVMSLAIIAQKMETTERKLSELFSKELDTNFYEYMNNFKIELFKQRVEKGDANHLTLLAIAYESGFHSKATFNRIFKKYTGLTPSEFKKQVEENYSPPTN